MPMLPRSLLALALAALILLPAADAALAPPSPGMGVAAAEPVLFLRTDPDGNRTLVLWLEDDPVGPYVHRRQAAPQPNGDLREVGTYTHAWTHQGAPMVTVGVYTITKAEGLVRVPRIIVENAADDVAVANALAAAALTDLVGSADSLAPFALEVAAPDLGDFTQGSLHQADFVQRPTVIAWEARRALPGADAWLGTYLARDAALEDVPGGKHGWRSVEVGQVVRLDGQDTRLAGAWVKQEASFAQGNGQRTAWSETTVGLRTPAGTTPLAAVKGEDARTGQDLRDPAAQSSGLTISLHGPEGPIPVLGLRTDVEQRFHGEGVEVTRTTAAGVFVQGAFVPLAGTRYHAERQGLLDLPFALASGGGLGSNNTGDAELSVGAYPQGAYEPLAQVTLDDNFAGATMKHRTMVGVGVFTPVRYQPLAAATYEGTHSLVDWALALVAERDRGSAWLVSAGPWAGHLYAPVVGVRWRSEAPGVDQAHEGELAVGTFAAGYTAFVPLAAWQYSSDQSPGDTALRLGTEGLGMPTAWQSSAGAYTPGNAAHPVPLPPAAYVPLVGVRYGPTQDAEWARAADLDVLVGEQPVLGVQYRGQKGMVHAFNNLANPNDDSTWQVRIGAHTPAGFVPLVRMHHDHTGNTVILGPDVPL
jgi:hypothetical protein